MVTGNLKKLIPARTPSNLHSDGLMFKSRPRPISTGLLKTLLPLHIQPINLVVYQGSYLVT